MMGSNCTGAPLSWLLMEQYHLGELPNDEMSRVKQHLESCPGCAQCMDSIENSSVQLKPLPPLPESRLGELWNIFGDHWKMGVGVAAAAAALTIAVLFVGPTTTATSLPPASMGYKGGDLAIGLSRSRDGAVDETPTVFEDGDRFNVRVTCPPTGVSVWDVVIFQGEDVFFPYDNREPLECGNLVPLRGAFSLSGDAPTVICVVVDEEISRDDIAHQGIHALPHSTVCTTVQPVK
ncbi:MAG: zf-HC2 domain-containing protein [Deltaproteobacteria bacterium]|nr:zf-HC2 domain-containing protein [Deltaproteobacteria bacterium]MBN2674521.1 zf-HC2 domain-containing protein [Deltaproteobacteria bacterium]